MVWSLILHLSSQLWSTQSQTPQQCVLCLTGLYTGPILEKADVPQALPASSVDKKNGFGTSDDI